MKGYGWQSAAAGGLGALAELLGQYRQTKAEREREERGLQERAASRRQDMTELQLREAGAGARNIADNSRAERVEKARIEAARLREENEEQRRRMGERDRRLGAFALIQNDPTIPESHRRAITEGKYDALDPKDILPLLVRPAQSSATREDGQAFRLALEGVKDAYRDGNQKPEKIRPTEKAAFASKLLDAHESTGKTGSEFWDFLETLGAGDMDDAARLGMTRNDYLAEYNKRNKRRQATAEKSKGKNAYTPTGKAPSFSKDSTSKTQAKPKPSPAPTPKKKSYEDILG